MENCCKANSKINKCKRYSDGKIFKLPRKFNKSQCKNPKGFSMKASCAPYLDCFKQFLYNPNNPKKSFNVYIDKNPKNTIPIKYTTVQNVKNTIEKLENHYKKKRFTHKRIWQVGMIMKVRLKVLYKYRKTKYKNAKNIIKRYKIANSYFKFLGKRSKKKGFISRSKMKFKI